MKVVRRASARERKIAALIGSGIVVLFAGLWLLQRAGFDFGLLFGPCGFRQRTGLTCPTCGMTTAVLAFARGELLTAFYVQPAAGILCSLLVLTAFFAFLTSALGVYFSVLDRLDGDIRIGDFGIVVSRRVAYLAIGLLVILGAGWAVTLARALVART